MSDYLDYRKAIIRTYNYRKLHGELPPGLQNPSPAKIKNECLRKYQSPDFKRKDIVILVSFLEVQEEGEVLRKLRRELDKFKPLNSYLRGRTDDPQDRHIELLGWLLDFEARPFDSSYDYESVYAEPLVPDDPQENKDADRNKARKGGDKSENAVVEKAPIYKKRLKSKMTGVAICLGVVAVLGAMSAIYFSNSARVTEDKACMIWDRDKFIKIDCDSALPPEFVFILEENLLMNQRRIPKREITESDIGKVWYVGRGRDSIDLFKIGGWDPVNPRRDLRRLSRHVYDKYVRNTGSQ